MSSNAPSAGLSSACRPEPRPHRSRRAAFFGALAALATASPGAAQFVLWESHSVPNPFSVTASVRGVAPAPSVKLEGLVGFAGGSGNQFAYHATPALAATVPVAGSRAIDLTQPIEFTDFGVQPAFNGRCCSNNSIGLTDDTTLHASSNFGAGTSSEFLIGTPQLMNTAQTPSSEPDGFGSFVSAFYYFLQVIDEFDPEGTISFERIAVGSDFPGAGLPVQTIDGPVGTAPVHQLTLDDCLGVSSNWHFTTDGSAALGEHFVACVKTNGALVLKRVEIDPDQVTEVPLVSGVGTSSPIFAYLHTAACPVSNGTVVGTVIPRQSLGTTTFFATYLSAAGAVVGTSQVTLPGARANHQAFSCRSRGPVATFVYHGTGQNPTATTDTFVVETGQGSLVPPPGGGTALLVHRVTESRRTDWADDFPEKLYTPAGQAVALDYRGLLPVAEIRAGTGPNVRYGGIRVPFFFHDFESGDLRFFSSVAP